MKGEERKGCLRNFFVHKAADLLSIQLKVSKETEATPPLPTISLAPLTTRWIPTQYNMATTAEESPSTKSIALLALQEDRQATVGPMAEREAKKRRLRELRETNSCVKTIVNHMGKHYRTRDPPPWLDLRAVAAQLMRSQRPNSNHAAWRSLRDSCTRIELWMSGHESWEDAVKGSKMPHIGTRSEIKVTEFIEGNYACVPKTIKRALAQIKLDFLLDSHPPSQDEMPNYWKGAKIDDPQWRSRYMEKGGHSHHIPFVDDLTDLVLSVVCHRGRSEGEQQEDSDGPEPFSPEATAQIGATRDPGETDRCDAGTWKNEVQATMSRIAVTVTEALAAEQTKLLGKRRRQESERDQDQNKRQRAAKPSSYPPDIMNTIEESDDNPPPEPSVIRASTVRDHEQLRGRRSGYKKLKKDFEELATRCSNLEGSRKKLEEEIEHLTKQQKDMRHGHGAGEQDQGRIAQKCDGLETQIKTLEVRCTATTDDVRRLEDKGSQTAAQCSALEDENKLLRSQIVSLITRVEALEQAKPAQHTQSGPAQDSSSQHKTAYQAASVRSRQHSTAQVSHSPEDDGQDASAPTPAASHWQSTGAVKHEATSGRTTSTWPGGPYKRSGSRFPRVLDMPTFEPDWDPKQEVYGRHVREYTRPPRLTSRPDSVSAAKSPLASYPRPRYCPQLQSQ
ncbi:hypothetical protein N658DRAFT_8218 [Parathielavia hyrcaniae]|uniref:Uncharacterized protein n=1 Tax=Parathielavia hyrcaniae TaxID=113614 RepID=A0AAN6QDA4_9PEZI|nr:hypothetical protein N658DRAFT_8218 [Parathielavia hyrcaniae]